MTLRNSIIFIAGAWHSEFHVQPLIPYLSKHNLRTVPLQLETSKELKVPATITDDITLIHNTIQAEISSGHKCFLVSHSVAGKSTIGAIAKFLEQASSDEDKRKLVGVAFLASFGLSGPCLDAFEDAWLEVNQNTRKMTVTKGPAYRFYNGLSEEEARPYVDALVSHYVDGQPDEIRQWWDRVKNEVPVLAYFLCLRDHAVPPYWQRKEAEDLGVQIVELDSDHCPMVSRPEMLADEIVKVLLQGKC